MINWFSARLPDNSALQNIIKQIALCKLDPDTQKNKSNFLPGTIHQSTQDISIFKYENPNHKTYRPGISPCSKNLAMHFSHDSKSAGKAGLLWHILVIPGCMSCIRTKMKC